MKLNQQIYLLILFALFCVPNLLMAQEARPLDVIHLKDGSIIKGSIISKKPTVQLEMLDGQEVRLDKDLIDNIEDKVPKLLYFPNGVSIRTKGFYHISRIGFGSARSANVVNRSNSFILEFINGYQFNHHLMLGLGLGLNIHDNNFNANENFIFFLETDQYPIFPVFAEIRGMPWLKKVAPYYSLQGGYGFAADLFNEWIATGGKLEGGIMAGMTIGVKVASRKKSSFLIHLSYKMQKASGERNDFNGFYRISDITFHRTLVGLGWQF